MRQTLAVAAVASLAAFLTAGNSTPDISSTLQNILANTDRSDLYTYPTDLTREIVPVGIIPLQRINLMLMSGK